MATGSLTDCPWLFKNLSGHLGLQAFKALGRLPGRLPLKPTLRRRPSLRNLPQDNYEVADSMKPATENAGSQGPTMKSADSKKPAKTAPTETTPT